METISLGLAWLVWCLLHSLLVHPPVEQRLQRLLGAGRKYYRLLYNLFALLSLVPVGLLFRFADKTPVLVWPDWLRPLQWGFWLAAALLVVAAARVYDLPEFLGTRQISAGASRNTAAGSANDGELCTTGVLRFSRHPWYLAGLILLWSRSLTVRDVVTNVLLTLYLLVGMRLEERKLLHTFGREYREYRKQVPLLWRLFPKSRR